MTTFRKGSMALTVLLAFGLTAPSLLAADAEAVTVRLLEDTPERVVIEYTLGEFGISPVMIGGQEYASVTLGDESLMKEVVGAPELPNVCRSIIIPDDAQMAAGVVSSKYREISGVSVVPSKGFLPRTINPADVPYTFGDAYGIDAFYPGQVVSLGEPYIMRDHRGVVVELNPIQFNPVTQTLRVYESVTIEVVTVGPGVVNVLEPSDRALSLAFHQIYKHHFLNYGGLRYAPLDEEGDMLIICHDAWLPNIQPLVDHKNAIGIDSTAVGVSTIGNTWSQIKAYIQTVYDSSDLAFVLLVGDGAQIDTPYASGGSSDPTYSKLAGGDNYPDIMVGRFSAETAAHVDTQVLRTVEYENMPATEQDWFWRGTGVASNQGVGDDGEYDNEHIDNIRDDLLAYGYTQVDQIYDPSGTAAQVTAALNAGRGIINYCGHGSTTSWGSTGFSVSHVNALTNDNMLPFIVSVACVNGQFDGYTCFAEAWLRATNGSEPTGAIGAYMSSINQSWSPPMEGQDAFNLLYVSESYVCYGTLCFAGSCSMMDAYGSGGVEMFDTWHIFGDPSVRVVGVAYNPPLVIELPDGAPGFFDPFEPTAINVQILDWAEAYSAGTGTLHYRYDGGTYQTVALTPLGGNLFEAVLPAADCDDTPEYYFSASGDGGSTIYYPEEAPGNVLTAIVATVTDILKDDFESDRGWAVVNDPSLTAGAWERGMPADDGVDGDPTNDFDGSGQCYLTGNWLGNSDVDGGPTHLVSPVMDMSWAQNPVLKYACWWSNDDHDSDPLDAEISNDGGQSWILMQRMTHPEEEQAGWAEQTLYLTDYTTLTAEMQIRFSAMDNPNNSKSEGGIDAVELVDLACGAPCAAQETYSCRDHGPAGRLCYDVGLSGGVEARTGGVAEIDVVLDDAAAFAGVVSVDCSPGGWNGLTGVSVDGGTVTVSFEPALPEGSCCTVGLDCGAEVCVCGLEGDMDGDGAVSTGDASIIKPAFGTIPDAASARFDVDLNGLITTSDFSVVKPRFGNTLLSPCP